MKKLLIGLGVFVTLLVLILFWLAGSVGPETAPQDTRSIELLDSYDN